MTKIAVCVPDMHVPYHDPVAVNIMFSIMKDLPRINELVILGDLADFFGFSLHPKMPDMAPVKETIREEIHATHEMLDRFDKIGADKKVYIEGNHEDRAWRFINKFCPALYDVVDYKELLRIEERGYEWVKFSRGNTGSTGQLYRVLDCNLYARHRPYSGGKHIAMSSMDKKFISLISGDTHRVQRVIRKRGDGSYIECLSAGCLIDFKSPVFSYMDTDDWAQGFAIVYKFSDDPEDYIIDFINIKNGKAVYHGHVYEG